MNITTFISSLLNFQASSGFGSSLIFIVSVFFWLIRLLIEGMAGALDACVHVFADAGNTKVIIFSAMVGALITFTQYSGGMEGFINWVTEKRLVRNRMGAQLLAWVTGLVIFIESSICVLITGAIARPLFDKFKISREKLAYIADSTSAPKCVLFPLNAWGAFIMMLLAGQGIASPAKALVGSIFLNFYAWFAIGIVLLTILLDRDFGPMKKAEKRVREQGKLLNDGAEPVVATEVISVEKKSDIPARMRNMLIPILVLVIMMPLGLYITGVSAQINSGTFKSYSALLDIIMSGSGSTAVFWAVLAALVAGGILYASQRIMTLKELMEQFMKGVGGLIPLAILMMLAFAIGDTCKILGTGTYVARVAKTWLVPQLIPAMLFLISCFIAFSTGTSWGTFAIMIPIAIPIVNMLDLPETLVIATVLGGGVFGDHCSPISDTTIIASMAAATDHIDHVRTQIPYAFSAAGIALVFYLIAGLFL
ncbi:sodium:solute symporter [candidate division KSB1 bacterium]|nr:sodium:solute symporter [candidate division KSB1 bacterium]